MNIVLVVVDTLRADHLGCYGYERATTPHVDRLAEEGILFTSAYPSDVPTQPSYSAMFTGRRGICTGVVSHSESETLLDTSGWFPQILAEKGYETAVVSTLYFMKRWFARGFKSYLNPVAGFPQLIQKVTADQINQMAIPWLKENYKRDFFLFLHYWDPHMPYIPPEKYENLYYHGNKSDPHNHSLDNLKNQPVYPFMKRLLDTIAPCITDIEYVIAQYDAEITYTDEKIGKIIDVLKELDILDDTLIIFTSDHGESLGEHNIYFDHASVYEPTVHVPLILRHPSFSPGERIEALVQLIDIAPTIFEFLDLDIPEFLEGRSLLPLIKGEVDEQYREICINQGVWQAARAVRDERFKFIKFIDRDLWPGPTRELFDLQKDPKELNNISEQRKDIADEMELKLVRWEMEKLGKEPDPLRLIASKGLAPKEWIKKASQ